MVGIGGGAPSQHVDIRLGDVVVSKPNENFGGVVQYDYGKTVHEGIFKRIGTLNKPPQVLLTAMSHLQADHRLRPSRIPEYLSEMAAKYPSMLPDFAYCGRRQDQLLEAQYEHNYLEDTCEHCDPGRLVSRPHRPGNGPVIHYGLIASGNQVMKHGRTRDRWARELGILCFEMEAAGLMDHFPCLVIRGICDYADSHKNKQWQEYADATAAAYAKEILSVIPEIQITTFPAVTTHMTIRLPLATGAAFNSYQDELDARCHPSTRVELLRDIYEWAEDANSECIFWLNGMAGTGKSTYLAQWRRRSPTVVSLRQVSSLREERRIVRMQDYFSPP
jgi:nucleoside phosphorylase